MSYQRTNTEYRAQLCIDKDETLFAKYLRGEQYTEIESEYIAECAIQPNSSVDAWIGIIGVIFMVVAIGAVFYSLISLFIVERDYRKWKKKSDADYKAFMDKLRKENGKSR